MVTGEIYFGGAVAGVALKMRRCLAVWGGLALTVFAEAQVNLPPDVPATTILTAPEAIVPSGLGGSNVYRGTYTYAGSYLIESSTYDSVAAKPVVSFTVRSAATHGAKYTLKPGSGFKGQADPEVFSDGALLALTLRDTPNGQARVSVHAISTGKLLFTLRQPDAKSGDYFGSKVWFTSDRILVAASGVDRPQTNGGGLYVYNRTSGRFVGFVGSGVKNAYFGAPPSDQLIPYFQSSGRAALFVHGNRLFRFASDRLEKVSLPAQGTNKVWPAGALISGNYLVVRTGEQKANGTGAQGRVIVYDATKRTVLYQLRASGLKGGYDFPSGIAVSGSRLFVHDSTAAYPDSSRRGAIGAYVLSSGKPAGVRSFTKAEGVYQDGGSFALSGGLLWIKTSGDGQATRWLGCDPATLKHVRTLTPPEGSRFAGWSGPPQLLSGNRFGVIALRTEENPGAFLTPMSASGGMGSSVASVVVISPGAASQTTAGVLVYDMASSRWTHRLTLESEPAASYTAYFPDGYDRLRIAAGSTYAFRVALAEGGTKILGFDTALPLPVPAVTLESSISYVPQFGYSHELLRKAAGAGDFTLLKELPFGDGATHTEILPYSDYKDGVQYRLDGAQFSRRLSVPGPEQVVLNTGELATLAAVRGDIVALRVRGAYNTVTQSYAANSVRLVNVLTGAEVRTVYPSRGNGSGPVAFNDTYIVVGSPSSGSGDIEVFDATTGSLVRSLAGGRSFGSQLVLADDRLATSEITSSYQSGAYTYISRLRIYRLTDGELVHRLPLATQTSTSSFSSLPVTLVGAGGKVAARGYAEGGSFADMGEVRVHDMLTGERLFTVTAPEPAAGDYFGSALAAGGNVLAVEASGSGEVSVFDLTTGVLRHTLVIMDRTAGSQFVISTLSIDAAGDYLSWLVSDNRESGGTFHAKAAYVFDLNTGLEEVKVLQPDAGGLGGAGSFAEVLFTNRGLVAWTSTQRLLDYDLVDTLATPLAITSVLLDQVPVVRLQFPARKGVSYQPEFSADEGLTWEVLGSRHHGNGTAADVRIPLEGVIEPEALRFRLSTRWEAAPVSTGITPGGPSS